MIHYRLHAFFAILAFLTSAVPVFAWNIPARMLSAIITYQVLNQENPETIEKVKAALEKHPSHANQWQARLKEVPATGHNLWLFMQAAR
jgi:hypothetical protein